MRRNHPVSSMVRPITAPRAGRRLSGGPQVTTGFDFESMHHENRGTARFFGMCLIVATSMSVTGTVPDSVLHGTAGTVALSAGRSVGSAHRPTCVHPLGCGVGAHPRRRIHLL